MQQNQVNIHHYQGSFNRLDLAEIMTKVKSFVVEHLGIIAEWEITRGLSGYQASFSIGDIVKVCYDTDLDYCSRIHNDKFFIIFRGSFFDKLAFEKLLGFSFLVEKVTVTRFDIYLQDYNRLIEPHDLYHLAQNGQCKGFRSFRFITSHANGEPTGDTLELGRRGSNGAGKFLRIYDKEKESQGKELGIRWELEFSNARAVSAWHILCRRNFKTVNLAGMLLAACDWVEPTEADRRSLMTRLPWYQTLMDNAVLCKVPCPVVSTDIDVKVNWIEKQVSKTIAYIRLYLDLSSATDFNSAMQDFVDVGMSNLKTSDLCYIINDLVQLRKTSDLEFEIPTISELELFVRGSLKREVV